MKNLMPTPEFQAVVAENARLRAALRDIMSYIDAGQDPPSGQRRVPITIIQNGRDALSSSARDGEKA